MQVAQIGNETAILSGGLTVGQQIMALGAHLLHQGERVRLAGDRIAAQ